MNGKLLVTFMLLLSKYLWGGKRGGSDEMRGCGKRGVCVCVCVLALELGNIRWPVR